jgi:PAS domain S-box-containing protein
MPDEVLRALKMAKLAIFFRYALVFFLCLLGTPLALLTFARQQLVPALLLAAIVILYNTAGYLYLKFREKELAEKKIASITLITILADVLIFTFLNHLAGGIVSPFVFFYWFSLTITGMALSKYLWTVYLVIGAINLAYDGMLALEYFKILPLPQFHPWLEQAYANPALILAFALMIPLSFWIFGTFAVFAGRALRSKRVETEAGLESEVYKLKAALEKKLEEANAELYQKNKELEAALEEVKQAQKKIEESEERYRSLIENSPIGIILIDEQGIIKYENQAMAEILGVPKGEVSKAIGMNILEMPDVKAAGVTDQIKETLKGNLIKNLIFPFTSLYGKSSFLLMKGVPLKKEGKVSGVMLLVEDVTERKKAEEELKKHTEELEKMNKFLVGRELDMIELKKEVNRLLAELGRPKKYEV